MSRKTSAFHQTQDCPVLFPGAFALGVGRIVSTCDRLILLVVLFAAQLLSEPAFFAGVFVGFALSVEGSGEESSFSTFSATLPLRP